MIPVDNKSIFKIYQNLLETNSTSSGNIDISNIINDINDYEESQMTIDIYGTKIWKNKQGQFHRRNGPAIESSDGDQAWYINGLLHREDGPAIEYSNGEKSWYLNDEYYPTEAEWKEAKQRLGLKESNKSKESNESTDSNDPKNNIDISNIINDIQDYEESQMEVDQSGTKRWKNKQGQLHRRNGPAVEYADGTKRWYFDGLLHCEVGPAIEYAGGDQSWYINGLKYSTKAKWKEAKQRLDLKESKESIDPTDNIDISNIINDIQDYEESQMTVSPFGNKIWRNKPNRLHRRNGPAVEYANGDKAWYIDGKRHRKTGPAVESINGNKEWWVNDHKHREDGPAVELINGSKEYWINGQLHRLDGPAVEYSNGTKQWWLKGNRYNTETEWKNAKRHFGLKESTDNIDISNIINDINEYEESQMTVDQFGNQIWRNKQNNWHRRNGPALIAKNGTKEWYVNGLPHRLDGPAYLGQDGLKEWWANGKLHREDGPAVEWPPKGNEWYVNGKRHREDGPAVEYANGYKEWWVNGFLHRLDGPAVEKKQGQEWWIDGLRYSTKAKWKAAKQHRGLKESINNDNIDISNIINDINDYEESQMTVDGKGNKIWRNKEGNYHRVHGPAVEYANGDKAWYIDDELHRTNGPAIEYADGHKQWWLNGRHYNSKHAWAEAKKQLGIKESTNDIDISNIINDIQDYEESQMTVDQDGTKMWRNKQGQFHRRNVRQ